MAYRKMNRGKTVLFLLIGLIGLVFLSPSPSLSQQLNKRKQLDSASQARINRAMASSRQQEGGDIEKKPKDHITRDCNQNVAGVKVQKGQRAPREVTTVVRGDVISLCR